MLGKFDAYNRSAFYNANEHEVPKILIREKTKTTKEGVRGAVQTKMIKPGYDEKFPEELDELSFTGELLNKVRQDVFDFLSSEHKKLGYANPLDTYYLIQQVLDSNKIAGKVKGIR